MSFRSHAVGEAVWVLPATGGLCVKNFCQPRIGGKWCKTAPLLSLPARASWKHPVAQN